MADRQLSDSRFVLCLVFVICLFLPSCVISATFLPMLGAFNAIRPQGLQKVWQSRIEQTISILCGGFLSIFLSPTHHELILKTCGRLLFACWPYSMYWIFAPSPFQLYSKYLWTYFDCWELFWPFWPLQFPDVIIPYSLISRRIPIMILIGDT